MSITISPSLMVGTIGRWMPDARREDGHVRLPIGEDAISLGHAAGSSNDEEAVVQRHLYEIDHKRSVVKDQGASRHNSAFIVLCDVLCPALSPGSKRRSLSAVIADPRISPPMEVSCRSSPASWSH